MSDRPLAFLMLSETATAVEYRATAPARELAQNVKRLWAKEKESMSKAAEKAEKDLQAMRERRQELVDKRGNLRHQLASAQNRLGRDLAEGGDLDELTDEIARLERQAAALDEGVKQADRGVEAAEKAVRAIRKQAAHEEAQRLYDEAAKVQKAMLERNQEQIKDLEKLGALSDEIQAIVSPFQGYHDDFAFFRGEQHSVRRFMNDVEIGAGRLLRRYGDRA